MTMDKDWYSTFPKVKRNILLNPGPATTSNRVKYAQIVPDICPREKEFSLVLQQVAKNLTRFVADDSEYATILFAGSGTAAVESIISSVIGEGKVLIVNNGAYGERMCEIAEAYDIEFIEFSSPSTKPLDLTLLQRLIEQEGDFTHLAVVHHETTTGLLNDVEKIGAFCKTYQIDLIVDAMSSFAAIPIQMSDMNIAYLAASSNKNLQAMAGISFVIANKTKLTHTSRIKPRSYYLHLLSQHTHMENYGQTRFTPPVQTFYALREAILEVKEEGITDRYKRYQECWEALIKGTKKLGLQHVVQPENHGKLITAFIEPTSKNFDFNQLHDDLYEQGFTIYPGKLGSRNTFRVANIGDITKDDIEQFLVKLKDYFEKIGLFYI